MAAPGERQQEVDRNFEEFQKLLPELIKTKAGQFALMRHGQVVGLYDTFNDAIKVGVKDSPDGDLFRSGGDAAGGRSRVVLAYRASASGADGAVLAATRINRPPPAPWPPTD